MGIVTGRSFGHGPQTAEDEDRAALPGSPLARPGAQSQARAESQAGTQGQADALGGLPARPDAQGRSLAAPGAERADLCAGPGGVTAVAEMHFVFDSPVGLLGIVVAESGLRRVLLPHPRRISGRAIRLRSGVPAADRRAADAVRQITEYLRGERREFELRLDLAGVDAHMRAVLDELCARAPYGTVISYGALAKWSGCPGGARAVGQVMARNPLPLIIPCHRVVAAGGLGGYGGGLALKRRLLRLEGALTEQLSLLAGD